jgi:hypothetical protein
MRRLALVVLVVLSVAAGCSSSSDDAAPTTTIAPTTTTTTKPEITNGDISDNINQTLRPGLEAAFGKEKAGCIVGVLQDGATGKISADELLRAYETQCQVTASEVAGAIASADLIAKGATAEQGACVRTAFAKLTNDEGGALGTAGTEKILKACGIDPDKLQK